MLETKQFAMVSQEASFKLHATTWTNPRIHRMRVDIIDQYVDAHMPQTYVELFGASARANPEREIQESTCEYRELGANKPINHIVSTENNVITSSQLNRFIAAAGPETSIWRIPGGTVVQAVWDDWAGVDWERAGLVRAECIGKSSVTRKKRSKVARRKAKKRARRKARRIKAKQRKRHKRIRKIEEKIENITQEERWQRIQP